jgi:hypothetical protein
MRSFGALLSFFAKTIMLKGRGIDYGHDISIFNMLFYLKKKQESIITAFSQPPELVLRRVAN